MVNVLVAVWQPSNGRRGENGRKLAGRGRNKSKKLIAPRRKTTAKIVGQRSRDVTKFCACFLLMAHEPGHLSRDVVIKG